MGDFEAPRPSVLAAAVATIGAAVFAPAMGGTWIYDDHRLIANNLYVHSFRWSERWFTRDFWDVDEELKQFGTRMFYWRPSVSASYALDWQLSDGATAFFHLTNTAWHAVVCLLTFVTLRRWIGSAVPAFLAALLFAVHPTKAESVAWIAGRTDVLCMAFLLLASWGVARRIRGEKYGL